MTNLVANWLKLNKLLDKYAREDRDIIFAVHYDIQLHSILVDTFSYPNNTAIHYAAIVLPKLLSFPSAVVLFSSLEKSSIILRSILEIVKDTGVEVETCLSRFVEHYSHLQVNCPNIRRVCSVFCLNLFDVSIEFMDKSNQDVECSGINNILENALFNTNLCEDYANFFSKKLRKTDHIQKVFSVLKNLGDKQDLRILTPLYNFLPALFTYFLNAYPKFQPKCKKFHLIAFTEFIDGLDMYTSQSDSTQLIESRVLCLGRMLDAIEVHFRTFPKDEEIIAAQSETFAPLITKLIELYPDHPVGTASCMISIQKINHIIMEKYLQIIFESVLKTGVGSSTLLNHIFQIYSRLNQLDKLVQIVVEAVEELDELRFPNIPEFNNAVQNTFTTTSLSMCNRCIHLLLARIESNDSLFILCEILRHIISVVPVGELSNTSSQRDTYIQLITQLNMALHKYASAKLSSNTACWFILSFYSLLDSFISSLLVLNRLPFSRDWVVSIELVDMSYNDTGIIPTNWGKKWCQILSKMDEHILKVIHEMELNILLSLSRFSHPPFDITSKEVLDLLSERVTHTITSSTSPYIVRTILQYWEGVLSELNHGAKLKVAEYIVHYMNSSEHNTHFKQIITSNQFKEITILHPYIAYSITHQILSLMDSMKDCKLTLVTKLIHFFLTLIRQLDGNFMEEDITYHELACSVIQLISGNLVPGARLDGKIDKREIGRLLNLLDILPLYYLTIEIKINLLIGFQGCVTMLGISKETAERIVIYSTALLRGINDNVPRSGVKIKHMQEYLCTFELFAKYIYSIAKENEMDTCTCYRLFTEMSSLLFSRMPVQFNSLTRYATGMWEDLLESGSTAQANGLLIEITRSLISVAINVWVEFKYKNESTQGDLLTSLNAIIEISTPILLKHLKHPNNKKSLQLLAVNLKYIFLSKRTDTSPRIEEAILKIARQALEFIREDTVNDVITLEAVSSIADTLRQHNHKVTTVPDDHIHTLMMPIQNQSWEVAMFNYAKGSDNIAQDRYLLTKKCVLGLIGCTSVESIKVLINGIIEGFEKEYNRCCHLLSWMIEGNIPDTHRSEIRKKFQTILSKLTEYLIDREETDGRDSFITLRLLTTILKLPSSIGLSSRLFVQALTPLSLISLDAFTQAREFSLIFQAKSQCLYYSLRNYADNTTSCIPVFLLLTKELINSAFRLSGSTELTELTRLLETYTTHTVLSNYTYHLIQQYINSAQKWAHEQATKKALKPSILALIGFSKPETLLALQAQLNSTGKTYYAEMKEEYEKFYRFKGKT